jgi:hypothetical protein
MKSNTAHLIETTLIASLLIGVGFLAGCTQNNIQSTDTILSSVDEHILKEAYNDYAHLKQNLSYREARKQLLVQLNNNTAGVKRAELGVDGYTIFVTYSDGDFTAVDTFEYDEVMPQTNETSYQIAGESQQLGQYRTQTTAFDVYAPERPKESNGNELSYDPVGNGSSQKITCGFKKALVLGPCYWEFPKELTDTCINLLKTHGWTDDDLTVKLVRKKWYRNNSDCLNITPADYFNLQDYGIILFSGHGGVRAYHSFNETNLYLQFCYFDKATFIANVQLMEWYKGKKIIIYDSATISIDGVIHKIFSTYIRKDVLREEMSPLPSSYVYFSTCFGGYFSDLFLEKGAKIFLGWNNTAFDIFADGNMMNIERIMLENSSSVYDAYANRAIAKWGYTFTRDDALYDLVVPKPQPDLPQWRFHPNVRFAIYPDPQNDTTAQSFYFPAWANLIVTNIPEGTVYLRTRVYNSSFQIGDFDDTVNYSATQIVCTNVSKFPMPANETVTLEVYAYDRGGTTLQTTSGKFSLHAGANDLQLNFPFGYLWVLSGGPEKDIPIECNTSSGIIVRVNGNPINNYWASFPANPGDSLRIFTMNYWAPNQCCSLGPVWLLSLSSDTKVKLIDSQNLGCWPNATASQQLTVLYDQTFTVPHP